ncbi:MAG: hypothetical protein EOP48_10915 [Sphingobacteriales bacterium]|nr:MAG: hypothetical protein EOP48_10915 [Sphingobacteriales bacterium]
MSGGVLVVQKLMQDILQLVRENRYLAAFSSLQEIELMQQGKCSTAVQEHVQVMMFKHREVIATLRSRYNEVMNQTHPQDHPTKWLLGSQQHGVTTHYQLNPITNTLLLKMESVLEGVSLMDIVAVTQEVDLFPLWLPACNECLLVNQIDHSEILFYLSISVLSIMRDVAIHWYGVDCLQENNTLLLPNPDDQTIHYHSEDGWKIGECEEQLYNAIFTDNRTLIQDFSKIEKTYPDFYNAHLLQTVNQMINSKDIVGLKPYFDAFKVALHTLTLKLAEKNAPHSSARNEDSRMVDSNQAQQQTITNDQLAEQIEHDKRRQQILELEFEIKKLEIKKLEIEKQK